MYLRIDYHKNQLDQDTINQLNAMTMNWLGRRKQIFNHNYELCVQFYQQHGHLRVTEKMDPKLYEWVRKKRKQYRRGNLSNEVIELLNTIGMVWEIPPVIKQEKKHVFDYQWNEKYIMAKEFYQDFGHLEPDYKGYPVLKNWLNKQRRKHRYHKLTKDKVKLLDSIGMRWDNVIKVNQQAYLERNRDVWMNHYQEVKQYYHTHGHIEVKKKENRSLYNWLTLQKRKYRNGYLDQEYIQLLELLNMKWKGVK